MTTPKLYLGNKNYSSWSMRPWLALRWGGVAFEEFVIPLGGEGYGKSRIKEIVAISPSGRVPALHVDGLVINDSLAICEWANEAAPDARLWPEAPAARALGRAAAAEMHAGFAALRRDMSMNIRRRLPAPPAWPDDTRADLVRLFELWAALLDRFGGPWLVGSRSIADAMYAPVVTRLRTYAVETPPPLRAYCETVLNDPDVRAWEEAASAESWTIPQADCLYA